MMVWLIIGFLAAILAGIKFYNRITLGKCQSYTCLVGKTAIVTGANTSIGYVTALEFAKRGARVILACRNSELAEEAKTKIIDETGNPNILVKLVNLASLQSVRDFVADINKSIDELHILVNNAGAGALGDKKTADGLNMVMQINHFGPFLLTNLLIDLMKRSQPSRIINVASLTAQFADLDINDLNACPKAQTDFKLYSNSKLCNILFTNELSKRLNGTQITTNSLHPGAINSGIWRKIPTMLKTVVSLVETIFFKSVEEGAETTVYVSVAKELAGVSGKYFVDCREKKPCALALDSKLAKQVWDKSMEMVHLKPDDLKF